MNTHTQYPVPNTQYHLILAKKKALHAHQLRCPFYFDKLLNYRNICGGRPFLSLLYIKCNPVTLIQGFKSRCIDTCVMNENIRPIFLLDEAKSFLIAEPFHCPSSHRDNLLSKKCRGSKLQVIAPLATEFPPKKETGTSSKLNVRVS